MAGETASVPDNSRFFMLALGLLVGFVIGFVMLLANLPVDQSTVDFDASPVAGSTAGSARTDFEFYTVLAGGEEGDGVETVRESVTSTAPAARGAPQPASQAPRQVIEASARSNASGAEQLARATAGPDAIPVTRPTTAPPVVKPATRVVPGSAQSLSRQNPAAAGNSSASVNPAGRETYYLQAGSFREAQSAERMRAAVLLLGLEAFIVTRQEADGGLGHRVRIGPFNDRDRLTEAKIRLRRGQVAYEIVRVTG